MKKTHPFSAIHADPWDPDLRDVASFNKGASDLLLQRIDEVRRAVAQGSAATSSTSVLLLGLAGVGKTHLFGRIRRQMGVRAVFVHTRPEIGADPSPRQALAAILNALRRPVAGQDRPQLEAIAGGLLASAEGGKAHFPVAFLDDCRARDPAAQRALIDRVAAWLEERCPEIWRHYLEQLLAAVFEGGPKQRALFTWLSGAEPSQIDRDLIGEERGIESERGEAFAALRTLGAIASLGTPIVLVFDQLENLIEEEGRTGKIVAHARLLSELRDTVKGLVLVQMALQTAWFTRIHPALQESDRDRLEETVHLLTLPTPEEKRQLIELWRSDLPERERNRPSPYPFSEAQVEAWKATVGMTPRMLRQACGEAYLQLAIPPEERPTSAEQELATPDEPLRAEWEARLAKARTRIDEEAEQERSTSAETIRGGLIAALGLLGVKAAGEVKKNVPSLQIRHGDFARDLIIGQHAHHRSLASVIRLGTALTEEHPVLLLRERAFAIRPTWREVEKLLAAFEASPGARFELIDREDLARLIALEDLLTAARSQDLCAEDGRPIPQEEVMRWARSEIQCAEWEPVKAAIEGAELRASALPEKASDRPARKDPPPSIPEITLPVQPPRAPPLLDLEDDLEPGAASDMEGRAEADALGSRIVTELRRFRVGVTIRNTEVGNRFIVIEVHCPTQRVAALDRAAVDVEHQLSEDQIRFARKGARRFFEAPRREPLQSDLDDLLAREEAYLRGRPGRFLLGTKDNGEALKGDLSDGSSCHLLIGGQTGSGKSVLLRVIAKSLCRFHGPDAIRITLVDPKRVTFANLADQIAPYLTGPVIYDPEALLPELEALVDEMEQRYVLMEKRRAQNIDDYNSDIEKRGGERLARRVVIVDEFQDLMVEKALKERFKAAVNRLSAKARAAGIHLILATQRPDRNTVPGELKANLCGRIALRVQEAVNSRIILDQAGAEALLGNGDLLANLGHGLVRAQAPMA